MITLEQQMVNEAQLFASHKHFAQKDDNGKPYINHLFQVVMILRQITDDYEILCAAWLHDTLEDTETTYNELIEEFGEKIASLVHEVTHEGKPDEHGYYFPRLKSKEAIMLKLSDRLSNTSRMDSWNKKRQEAYLKKTKFWRSE